VSRFRILSAHVTAVPNEGKMVVVASFTLLATEDRQEALRDDGKGQPGPSALEYFCPGTVDETEDSHAWNGQGIRIVFTGIHEMARTPRLLVLEHSMESTRSLKLEVALPQIKVFCEIADTRVSHGLDGNRPTYPRENWARVIVAAKGSAIPKRLDRMIKNSHRSRYYSRQSQSSYLGPLPKIC
jgi:hypothetical protein